MQVELPPEVTQEFIKRILQTHLKAKRDGTPFERLVSNLFTQNLRGWIASLAALEDSHDRLHKMADLAKGSIEHDAERVNLLMGILTMLVHKVGGSAELIRAVDAEWYDSTDLQLRIEHDDDKIVLKLKEEKA
jgi:hypothetical protein